MRPIYINRNNISTGRNRNNSPNNQPNNSNNMKDDKKGGDDKGGKPKPRFDMRGLFTVLAIAFGLWGAYTVFESKKAK